MFDLKTVLPNAVKLDVPVWIANFIDLINNSIIQILYNSQGIGRQVSSLKQASKNMTTFHKLLSHLFHVILGRLSKTTN